MHTIAKICADHLRAFSNQHGINLKSSHAHELVAAFSGYKSKAAMLADKDYPVENIDKAKVLVRMPTDFIVQRLQCLENLPSDKPQANQICEELATFLEQRLSYKFFSSWQHLAAVFTKMYLQKHKDLVLPLNFRLQGGDGDIFDNPEREFDPEIKVIDGGVELIVVNKYSLSNMPRFQGSIDTKVSIKLRRMAGHVGYSNAEITFVDGSIESVSQTGVIR